VGVSWTRGAKKGRVSVMKSSYLRTTPLLHLAVLTEGKMHDLHLAALEVLRRTGVEFQHEGAVELLKEAGRRAGYSSIVVSAVSKGLPSTISATSKLVPPTSAEMIFE